MLGSSALLCLLALASRGFALSVSHELVLKRSDHPRRLSSRAAGSTNVPEIDDQSFWFANFTIGASKSTEILIDTGSSDLLLNPGQYMPGKKSQNLHRTFSISFATTNSNGSGSQTDSGDIYSDRVGIKGLFVPHQDLGSVTKSTAAMPFPHQGLIGFGSVENSALTAIPYFQNLCDSNSVDACRFGLAFGTKGKGTQVLGRLDHTLYKGALHQAPITSQWALFGDIALNNKVIQRNAMIQTDSGTTVVYGPIDAVRSLYKAAKIQTVLYPGNPSYLYGYFPCDKPPTIGFNFPSDLESSTSSVLGGPGSNTSKIFNIVPSVWSVANNGHNNCTAVLQGTDAFGSSWLVGQAFFQGHYIDHSVTQGLMGFADLA